MPADFIQATAPGIPSTHKITVFRSVANPSHKSLSYDILRIIKVRSIRRNVAPDFRYFLPFILKEGKSQLI
jgi:hypothetical protein